MYSPNFPCKGIQVDEEIRKELQHIGFLKLGTAVLKGLQSIQRRDLPSRVDIPSGLFGLSVDNFYDRLRENENTVYIDVLQKISSHLLEDAKISIILEDLYNLIKNLFVNYKTDKRKEALEQIEKCQNLLTAHDTILNDFKRNSELYKKLQDKLSAFNVRSTNAILHVNGLVYGVQNDCVESELIVDPIEFRYKMSFHHRQTEQTIEKAQQIEAKFQNTLDELRYRASKEAIASDSIQIKQRIDIENLKARLDEMTEKYDKEYEYLEGQIMYKTNAIESMQTQYEDSIQRQKFYEVDIERLKEWHEWWDKKEVEKKLSEYKVDATKKSKKGKKK